MKNKKPASLIAAEIARANATTETHRDAGRQLAAVMLILLPPVLGLITGLLVLKWLGKI